MAGVLSVSTIPIKERTGHLAVVSGPEISPATAKECVDALVRLTSGGGSPRWAAVGWAVDLAGPMRSIGRAGDDGDGSGGALDRLIARLAPEPPQQILPRWIRGNPPADELATMLDVGQAAGKPGMVIRCDVPVAARDLVAALPGNDGWVRFRHPSWAGSALRSDGRLAGLVSLVRWRKPYPHLSVDVATLVGWTVGKGRADVGCWVRRNPARGRDAEASGAMARIALQRMSGLVVGDVVSEVIEAAG